MDCEMYSSKFSTRRQNFFLHLQNLQFTLQPLNLFEKFQFFCFFINQGKQFQITFYCSAKNLYSQIGIPESIRNIFSRFFEIYILTKSNQGIKHQIKLF